MTEREKAVEQLRQEMRAAGGMLNDRVKLPGTNPRELEWWWTGREVLVLSIEHHRRDNDITFDVLVPLTGSIRIDETLAALKERLAGKEASSAGKVQEG